MNYEDYNKRLQYCEQVHIVTSRQRCVYAHALIPVLQGTGTTDPEVCVPLHSEKA